MARPDPALLRTFPLLATLDKDDLAQLGAAARIRRYPRGQVIFQRDDPSDALILVQSGRVEVVVTSADGAELILTVVGAGEVLGEAGLAHGDGRSADAKVLDAAEVILLDRASVLALAQRNAPFALSLLQSVSTHLRRLTDATADLVFLDLPRRVAKLILDSRRSDELTISLGLNQEQMAQRVGGTRQSVNAALRSFERRGWMSVRGQVIALTEPEALTRFAAR